ncbi:MAG: hypothetical protein WD872_00975 [Pirellulaceae bacterium]
MKKFLSRLWHETDGVLSFEWTLLTSLLTVGVVSGIAAVRDGVTDEMGDLAEAMVSLDQSYAIQPPLRIQVHTSGIYGAHRGAGSFVGLSGASDSAYIDASHYDDRARRGSLKVIEFSRRGERPGATAPTIEPETTDLAQ